MDPVVVEFREEERGEEDLVGLTLEGLRRGKCETHVEEKEKRPWECEIGHGISG